MTNEQVYAIIAVNVVSIIVGVGLVWTFCWWAMASERSKRRAEDAEATDVCGDLRRQDYVETGPGTDSLTSDRMTQVRKGVGARSSTQAEATRPG